MWWVFLLISAPEESDGVFPAAAIQFSDKHAAERYRDNAIRKGWHRTITNYDPEYKGQYDGLMSSV